MLTNTKNIPLSVGVWLARDSYDRIADANYISATMLLRPTKQLILAQRVDQETAVTDISDVVASRMGTAIHDAIEMSWKYNYHQGLQNLNVPQQIIDRVLINPTAEALQQAKASGEDPIPVYMEQRQIRELNGYKIGGKFDFIVEGKLEDFKSTKTYSYTHASNVDDYTKQASIYRWLNQDKVTEEQFKINYIFTDWLRSKAAYEKNYPHAQIISKEYPLMSLEKTEAFIADRIACVEKYKDCEEYDIPECTDEELWRSPPVYKYYKNPASANKPGARSTKNFDTLGEANIKLVEDGSIGRVVEKKGEVKRCNYCPAFSVCQQKDSYIAAGILVPID